MRFILLLAALCLLLSSLYLACIFGPASYGALTRLGHVPYYEYAPDGPTTLTLAVTPERYAAFRTSAAGVLGGSLLATLWLLARTTYRRELRRLAQELRRAGAALWLSVRGLSASRLSVATGLLAGIFAMRLLWFLVDPLSPDEITSFDTFVREGPVAITSFYPIPNNHVFYNFTSWLVAQGFPGQVPVIMRLPALLVATAGTALSYALLSRVCNFRVATLVTALFGLTRLTLICAASGRGYYFQVVCMQAACFCVVELLTHGRCRRLAWALFVFTGVIGLYTVPTYVAPLASLSGVLLAGGLAFEPNKRRGFLRQLAGAGLVIGTTTAVLYAPVGCVSGWPRLLGNRYLASVAQPAFWRTLPAYAYEASSALLGPARPALLLTAALMGAAPLLLLRAPLSAPVRWLAWVGWAMLAAPVVLMLGQRVFIPARALTYVVFFWVLLAAVGAEYAATRWPGRWAARAPVGFLFLLLTLRAAELAGQVPDLLRSRDREAAVGRAYQWLLAQSRGPVYLSAPYHALAFYHYGLLHHRPLTLHSKPVAGVRYAYLVCLRPHATPPSWVNAAAYRRAYQDELVIIYQLRSPTAF